jgi:hypothetical protein
MDTVRFEKAFAIDGWIALFHACDFNMEWERRHAEAAIAHRYLSTGIGVTR